MNSSGHERLQAAKKLLREAEPTGTAYLCDATSKGWSLKRGWFGHTVNDILDFKLAILADRVHKFEGRGTLGRGQIEKGKGRAAQRFHFYKEGI